jgi:hypothetical protein
MIGALDYAKEESAMPHSKHHPGILLEAVSKTKKNVSGQPEY